MCTEGLGGGGGGEGGGGEGGGGGRGGGRGGGEGGGGGLQQVMYGSKNCLWNQIAAIQKTS